MHYDLSQEALDRVKMDLSILQSKLEKQRVLAHDFRNILENMVVDELSVFELDEKFALVDFLLDEKLKEIKDHEELLQLAKNYQKVGLCW